MKFPRRTSWIKKSIVLFFEYKTMKRIQVITSSYEYFNFTQKKNIFTTKTKNIKTKIYQNHKKPHAQQTLLN